MPISGKKGPFVNERNEADYAQAVDKKRDGQGVY